MRGVPANDDFVQTGLKEAALHHADLVANAEHARLRDAGVDVDEQVLTMDGPPPDMFWLRDADGNTLLVVEAQ